MLEHLKRGGLWGFVAGVVLAATLPPALEYWEYDVGPVVDMAGTLVSSSPTSAVIRIKGRKLKPCLLLAMHARTFDAAGVLRDAQLEKISSGTFDLATKPVGEYDLGLWRITADSGMQSGVMVVTTHSCRDRFEASVIARVAVSQPSIPVRSHE